MSQEFIWTDGIESALNDIKDKSLTQCEYHKTNYYFYKSHLKYFRVPTIVLSGMNSVFSVGLQPYISQSIISVLCCSISLICGIIASVELFLGIQNMMERELISSKEFYILSYDIFKILSIEREHRMVNGKTYLDNIHVKYCNLIESANLLNNKNKNNEIVINTNNLIDYGNNTLFHLFENNKKNEFLQIENINKEKLKDIINSSRKNEIYSYKFFLENKTEEKDEDLKYKKIYTNTPEKIVIQTNTEDSDYDEEKQ